MKIKVFNQGYSLMEVMVAIGVFALLAVLVTQSLAISLKSVRKSDAQNRVRANLDFAVSVMERQLRNANSIGCCAPPDCQSPTVSYTDSDDVQAFFVCDLANGNIASNSADRQLQLTASDINITACSFVCTETTGIPDTINISLEAIDNKTTGAESARVSVETQIMLRNY